ncbi:MAG: ThiF family adenylyltransferase [Bdellovibrionales bacterium]|nr:ThiF family adenylyltransferase [Bdellovibrionales bacterium]
MITNSIRNENLVPLDSRTSDKSGDFYRELTTRNRHFIKPTTQEKLRDLRVLVAGCGAAGGACIEPLARVGVTHFKLADNGSYELSNLNRQHTFIDFVGVNKATFHAQELKRINPHVDVETLPEGVSRENLPRIIGWADIIIDAVDVTTADAIQLKFHLHELAHRAQKPVLSPLDPGFCQLGIGWDYRKAGTKPLHGRLELAKSAKNPIKALLHMFPISSLPSHSLQLFVDLLNDRKIPASQLGCSADLLSGIIVAAMVRFVETGDLLPRWYFNLDRYALSFGQRASLFLNSFRLKGRIKSLMSQLE